MLNRAESISAWNWERMGLMREPCRVFLPGLPSLSLWASWLPAGSPGQSVEAAQQVQLTVLGAADHAPEVASRRTDGLPFGGDHRHRGGRLVAPHGLTGVDPGGSADAELPAKSMGRFDDVRPVGRGRNDVISELWGDVEDEPRRDGRELLFGALERDRMWGRLRFAPAAPGCSRVVSTCS